MEPRLSYLARIVSLLALTCLLSAAALAQNATGSVSGVVSDERGELIANATVTLTNTATGASRKLMSRSEGNFVFDSLKPGNYELKAEAQGFSTQVQKVVVEVGASTAANFSMQVGAATQTIEVTGASTPLLNTTDTAVGGTINRDRVENLPLNGRSFLSIALLEPGVNVNYNANSSAGAPNNYFQISVGGAPQQMTVISVDGSRINDRITGGTSQNFSAETVQEFQISTLGFDLSSGTVSAGAVNIVSRTGGNNFHGSAFYFYRDHNMAAYPALNRDAFDPDPYFARNQFGGTFSGPIKKEKLFFFVNYEKNDQVGARTVFFEDPLLRGFNHVAQQPQDGDLFGLRLDYTINHKHTAFVRGGIDANDGSSGTGLESTWITSSNYAYQTQFGLTSVLRPTLVNDFRFSYSYFRNRLAPPTLEECVGVAGDPALCAGVGGARINFFGGLAVGNDVNVSQDRHPRTFQFTDNFNWTKGAHRVRFGGNYEYAYSIGTWNRNATGTFSAFSPSQVSTGNPALYTLLPASLKIGYTGPRPTFNELLQLPMTGTLTMGLGDPSQPAPWNREGNLDNSHVRLYAQDAWQIRKGFTLNYGLAWSFENNIVYHDIDIPAYMSPLLGNQLGPIPQDYNNFDPALGFAWAIGKDSKTVLRSSISQHHISPNVGFFNLNQRILFGPAGNGLSPVSGAGLQNPEAPPGSLLNFTTPSTFNMADMLAYLPAATQALLAGLPYDGKNPAIRGIEVLKTMSGLDAAYNQAFETPYTIQLNVGVQREIARNLSVSADYVMRRGVHFGAFELFFPDLNKWNRFSGYSLPATGIAAPVRNPVIPACTATNRNDPKAQCSLGPIQYGLPGILSRYSALQVKVDKRFSQGFLLSGSYALSRYTTFTSISSNDNLYDGHGISGGNPLHRFTFSGIWDLPKYAGEQKFLRGLLNGWQVSTIMEMRTGAPASTTLGVFDVEGDGTFVFRLPGTSVSTFGWSLNQDDIRKLVEDYNAKFPAPPNTQLRDIPRANRDSLGAAYPYVVLPEKFAPSDSFLSHDIRVTRVIKLTEKVRLNVIAEGFNIFNIANLTGFSGTLDGYVRPTATAAGRNPTPNFGQASGRVNPIFGSGGPRAFQIAARINF